MNALKHGGYSRQFARLGALLAASPAARESLLRLADRHEARGRKADELAAYILSQVIARGLTRGSARLRAEGSVLSGVEGLILLPPVDDAGSIVQNTETHEKKRKSTPRDNQSPGTTEEVQSKIR